MLKIELTRDSNKVVSQFELRSNNERDFAAWKKKTKNFSGVEHLALENK